MKNNEGWNKITKLVSKWVNVLQGDKTHLWVILVTRLKKRITSPFLGLNHWWIGYGTESHPLRRPVWRQAARRCFRLGSPVTNDSDASVCIGLASFRVRCSLPVDWSDGPSHSLLPALAGTSGSGPSAARPAAWACSTARFCVARCTPTAAWRCSPTAASTWRSPRPPAPASSRSAAAGGEGDDRGWDGWMASPTLWTGVWMNSGSWWWAGRPGVLQFMGSQSRPWLSDWTKLNWTLTLRSWHEWKIPPYKDHDMISNLKKSKSQRKFKYDEQ